jgi:hypothetical protein
MWAWTDAAAAQGSGAIKKGLSNLERPRECRKQKEELPAKVFGGNVTIESAVVEDRPASDDPAGDKRVANAHADKVPVAGYPVAIGPVAGHPCVPRSRTRRNICDRRAHADVNSNPRSLRRCSGESQSSNCQSRSQHPLLNAAHNPSVPGDSDCLTATGSSPRGPTPVCGAPARHHLRRLGSCCLPACRSAHFKHRHA